jgi:ABC-type Mn2+/Zn2+ transport system ATPase subunit
VIVFDRVSVHYAAAPALAEVSERVQAGEWLGIIGPNGAG